MSAEEWAQGEIIRTLTRLSETVEGLGGKLDSKFANLDKTFVTKEVFDLRLEHALNQISGQMVSKKAVVGLVIGISTALAGVGAFLGAVLH